MKRDGKKYFSSLKGFRNTVFFFALMTSIPLVSLSPGRPVAAAVAATVASVNQTSISSRTVDGMLRAYLSSIGHQELAASRMLSLREGILKRLIEEELLYQEGLREGLPVAESEIDSGVALIRDRFQSDQSYELALQKETLKRGDIRAGVKRSILINKAWSHLSTLTQAERRMRLKAISENADIQINVRPIRPISPISQMNHSLQPQH